METSQAVQHIVVVIPFFQRECGLLQRAVCSALGQTLKPHLIIIVDDGSPVSAASDIHAEIEEFPEDLLLIEQENAGPGAARNAALDRLPPGTEFVAFLDSDDEWTPDHLANAVLALDLGYDLYFADTIRHDWDSAGFSRIKEFNLNSHLEISAQPPLYEFSTDMVTQILAGNILGTSVTVYRYSKFSGLRFRSELRTAGEDVLFWIQLASRTKRIVFSTLCEAHYGKGVNICYGARWGSREFLSVVHCDIRYLLILLALSDLELTAPQTQLIKKKLGGLRRTLTEVLLHEVRSSKKLPVAFVCRHLRSDPAYAYLVWPLVVAIGIDWIRQTAFRRTSL